MDFTLPTRDREGGFLLGRGKYTHGYRKHKVPVSSSHDLLPVNRAGGGGLQWAGKLRAVYTMETL